VSDIVEKDSVTAVEKTNDTTIPVTVYYLQLTKARPKKKKNNNNNNKKNNNPLPKIIHILFNFFIF